MGEGTYRYKPRTDIASVLLPDRSEERGVLEAGSIPVAILPSCQDMKTIEL